MSLSSRTDGKKMRVMYVITGLGTGGAETMLFKLLSSINQADSDICVVSMMDQGRYGKRIERLGIPVYALQMRPGQISLRKLVSFIHLLRKWRPHVIQAWMYHACLVAQVASLLAMTKARIVWNIRHSLHSFAHEKPATIRIIKLCAKFSNLPAAIVYCAKVSAQHHEEIGFCRSSSIIIPNGFDVTLFAPSAASKAELYTKLELLPNIELIGLVARFHPVKNHTMFLTAASTLHKKRCDVHFVLVGPEISPDNAALVHQIHDLGISNVVHLLGEISDMHRTVSAFDIASLTSISEGFPNVVGEAMACGVPCVVTDVGDARWIVGETGRVIPSNDPAALVEAWEDILNLSKDERRILGEQTRQRIVQLFSLPQIVQQYESLNRGVFSEKFG